MMMRRPNMATDLEADAVTPETQAAAAARDGFVTYDELSGPDVDAARWSPARPPLPTGEHVPLDPNAELAVGEGEVRVTIPRLHPASRVRDHARPEPIDRDLACRRPHGVRDPRHLHPRTRSDRVWDRDDAADPARSQPLARRAGHERAVAPVPRAGSTAREIP
jgi:hypothetical protein